MSQKGQILVELQETMGSDRSIAEMAWTSSLDYQKKKSRTEQDVERVVRMLAEQKHATPFESVIFKFWLRLPVQTDRQHMTHRIGTHAGLSARYRTAPKDFLTIPNDVHNIMYRANPTRTMEDYETLCNAANTWYSDLLSQLKASESCNKITNAEYKRCREFFRGVLPQNNMVERVTIFNLRSFANYQKLRNSSHAQPEIRLVAELMLKEVKRTNICPVAIEWLEKNNWEL